VLRRMSDLIDCLALTSEGGIGRITDALFDDQAWVLRYLIVESTLVRPHQKILIPIHVVGKPDWNARAVTISLGLEQIVRCPPIDVEQPISRLQEQLCLEYYDLPFYWNNGGRWAIDSRAAAQLPSGSTEAEPRLRSANMLLRYHIEATDGGMGQVEGALLDQQSWAIRYLVVETSNWWAGNQVLLAPHWIEAMTDPDAALSVNLTRKEVADAPKYDPSIALSRAYEIELHHHHDRTGYWMDQSAPSRHNDPDTRIPSQPAPDQSASAPQV